MNIAESDLNLLVVFGAVLALKNGEVDLAIGNLPDLGAGFYVQRLFRDRYVCVVRKDHPMIGERIKARQFASASHAIVTPGGWGHRIIERSELISGLPARGRGGDSHRMRYAAAAGWLRKASREPRSGWEGWAHLPA